MHEAPSVWPAIGAFVTVLVLIPIALWVVKRLQSGGTGAARPVTLAGGLALGPRERVVVIEADGRRWLLGVTGQSITMLAELAPAAAGVGTVADPAAVGPATAAPPNPFAQMLERFKRHG
jgi:flagellar protein FliO/FliZ